MQNPPTEAELAQFQLVFDHWKATVGPPRARVTKERIKFCVHRLRAGYTVAELQTVIDLAARSPFWCGQNDRNTTYLDFPNLFRNDTRVDQFLTRAGDPARSAPSLFADEHAPQNQTELE